MTDATTSGSAAAVLGLSHVSKAFGSVAALRDVSIELFSGQVHAVAGENGAGKSTLIKTLAEPVSALDDDRLIRRMVGRDLDEFAIGASRQAAFFAGLRVKRYKLIVFVLTGVCFVLRVKPDSHESRSSSHG